MVQVCAHSFLCIFPRFSKFVAPKEIRVMTSNIPVVHFCDAVISLIN